jgi:hypothetical protein
MRVGGVLYSPVVRHPKVWLSCYHTVCAVSKFWIRRAASSRSPVAYSTASGEVAGSTDSGY